VTPEQNLRSLPLDALTEMARSLKEQYQATQRPAP
jgi:hypothetical protein